MFPAAAVLLAGIAHAGTVLVDTSTAIEVRLENQPVMRTFGAAKVSLPDIAGGQRTFVVYREGKPTRITVEVPAEGTVRLLVGETSLSSDQAVQPEQPSAAPPVVELRAATQQEFAVVLDGQRYAVLEAGHPLRLTDLATGSHALELRSADLLTIWARGTLHLQPGDDLVLSIAEGRDVEFFGRPEAWRPGS